MKQVFAPLAQPPIPSTNHGGCNLFDISGELTDLLQEYFICDWWFNFDCADAEGLYSRNEEIAAEREAASADQGRVSQCHSDR